MTLLRRLTLAAAAASLMGCGAGAATERPAPAAPASGAVASPSLPADFPLGTWRVTITEADLRAGGLTETGLLAENAGTFTKTFAPDGTWTIVQDSPVALRHPIFRGTYRATGPNEIEETTTFPPEYAGDVVGFTWAREGTGVRFRVVNPPDPILPVVIETHPWLPT